MQLTVYNAQTGNGPGACNNIVVGAGATTCGATATVSSPSFSPAGGTYTAAQSVTLASATAGASIYYTTDGSAPTTKSTLYTAPIGVSNSQTVKALAVKSGLNASSVASAAYTINPYGIISTIAGTGAGGYSGDGGQATAASIYLAVDIAVDATGNLYIADGGNNRLRLVTSAGVISTIAGTGNYNFAGDGGQATAAQLNQPQGVAVDSSGNIYLADWGNDAIRKITGGVISTIAGNGTYGYTGDGGAATGALLYHPSGPNFDAQGNLFFADGDNNMIRKITAAGIISTVAGTSVAGYNGDGELATAAYLNEPYAVAVDSSLNLFIADKSGARIRKVTYGSLLPAPVPTISPNGGTFPSAQTVTLSDTLAGASIYYTADGSVATTSSTLYSGPITVSSSHTINAVAIGTGYAVSPDTHAQFTINNPTAAPTFSPAGGTYSATQTVSLASATAGASIYYTTDGSTPTTASTLYTGAISVASTKTINAIALASGYTVSAVATATYTINLPATATPYISSTFEYSDYKITLGDTTAGAAIYYTRDGTTPTTASTLYSAPIYSQSTYGSSETIQAIALAPNYSLSGVSGTTTRFPSANVPTLSPAGGSYGASTTVTISDTATSAAAGNPTIYYTVDGSSPSRTSTAYSSPITVTGSETIRAFALGQSNSPSSEADATFTFTAAAPTFSPAGGTYTAIQSVVLSSTTSGASIYYTLDGSTPTAASTLYTAPISVGVSETVKALAVKSNYTNSAVASAAYVINLPAAGAPYFSPYAGTYDKAQTIALSSTTAGATFFYTTDGSTPTVASTMYTAPFSVAANTTVNAIAVKTGYANSAATSGAYTFLAGTVLVDFSSGFPSGSLTTNNASGDVYPTTSGGVLALENTSAPSTGTLYFPSKLPVTNFDTYFDFTEVNASADGFILIFQNAGANALGGLGGSLAFGPGGTGVYANGIPTSVGLKFDLYNNAGEGTDSTGVFLNGVSPYTPSVDMTSSGVILNSSHLLHCHVTYDGTSLVMSLQDSVTGAVFTHTFTVDIPGTVGGNIAYVGFGAASGSYNATQTMYNWTYASTSKVASTPTISVAAGTYTAVQSVTLANATSGAAIYYTTDGTTPTAGSTLYTGPITVGTSETLKAVAVLAGYLNSDIASAAYAINIPTVATPTFSPAAGSNVAYGTTVTIADATANAVIHYTTDGSTATASSAVYSGAIPVTASSTTLSAIAVLSGYNNSAVASASYYVYQTSAPTLSPAGGTYTAGSTVNVTITPGEANSTIYYTVDGSFPSASSPVYTTPIAITKTTTLRAYDRSPTKAASYTVNYVFTFQ